MRLKHYKTVFGEQYILYTEINVGTNCTITRRAVHEESLLGIIDTKTGIITLHEPIILKGKNNLQKSITTFKIPKDRLKFVNEIINFKVK
jgi:hypothetical protein